PRSTRRRRPPRTRAARPPPGSRPRRRPRARRASACASGWRPCAPVPPCRAASRVLSLAPAVAPDERVRGRVVLEVGLGAALELRADGLGEHLPELHAPLVERVDAPDH